MTATADVDRQLVEPASRGEPAAVRALYDRYSSRVYTIVRRLAADDALAQDWAQEAWIRIFRGLGSFRAESQLSSWVHQIALNTALTGVRRDRMRRESDELSNVDPPPALIGAAHDGRVLLRMELEDALNALPEGMRRVIVLHDIEGFTHEEIGSIIGTTASTSRSQLGRGRARLRELMNEYSERGTEE